MKLKAIHDSVIIKEVKKEKTGTIFVPDMNSKKFIRGEIVSVGPGRYSISGILIPPTMKVGDLVLAPPTSFVEEEFENVKYYIGLENQLRAIIEE